MSLKSIKLTKQDLIATLENMLKVIEHDDSFGGFIEYDLLDPELERDQIFVKASYRIGNSMGQGGMRDGGRNYK